ncbi:MAG: hypothetical protein RRA94_01175 [Bacteroidota bacterium]|nr:hypothetical protein [Bacteroidota bacterium]
MFDPAKDERLWRLEHEAGLTAFLAYFFLVLGLLIARGFVEDGVLTDPDFLLVVPWLATALVYAGVLMAKGYFSALREENTRSRELLAATRASLLVNIFLFTLGIFAFNRLNWFSDEVGTFSEDLMDASISGLLFGFAMWFFLGRKTRRRNKAE